MKLFEHLDFEQAIIRAAEHFRAQGLREAIIEKDYYVTEALRIIEQVAGGKVIFKGGDAGTFQDIITLLHDRCSARKRWLTPVPFCLGSETVADTCALPASR